MAKKQTALTIEFDPNLHQEVTCSTQVPMIPFWWQVYFVISKGFYWGAALSAAFVFYAWMLI